uniref:Neurotransmitter-gated ion-channel ligand-binding domain-containing protein n=1 Tax=Ditylenchus dipsaci TaxID=166011 RepID=A0A915EFC6_9BILA
MVQSIPPLLLFLVAILGATGQSANSRQSATQAKALRSRQINTETQIVSRLFQAGDYDAQSRPPVRDYAEHPAIAVILSIFINRIVWHKHSTAEVDLYLRQQWEDSRLSYEVDPREGIHEITLPKNRPIWKPDTFFIGAEEKTDESQSRSRIVIEPSGYVRSSEKRTLTLTVDNSESGMLSDKKTFKLKLSSYNYPIEDIIYLWANSPPNVLPMLLLVTVWQLHCWCLFVCQCVCHLQG